jgi:hypothetical protein
MELGSIFLILALGVLVVFFVSRPFFEKTPATSLEDQQSTDHERSAWLAERDRILNALQELDFDYTLGKIPPEDYPAQRAALVQRGAEALRKLDAMQPGPSQAQAEDRIEAAVSARRADAAVARAGNGQRPLPVSAAPDDELEAMLANRRRARQEKAAGFCPKCGKPLQKSDRFCPKCGAKI